MLALATFAVAIVSTLAIAPYGASRCYDCNYAPSGRYGYYHQSQAGLPQCALLSYGDAEDIEKWACKSGKCFIRLDKNGLVYRGCADQENLNFGVDTHRQCAYQGGSLYYFCEGDICNFGQIGHVCGHKPAPHKHYNHKNPCDGKCHGNPSGLFPDYHNPKGFIQCGCGNDYGKTCSCCRAFHLNCPYGTTFNTHTKTCTVPSY